MYIRFFTAVYNVVWAFLLSGCISIKASRKDCLKEAYMIYVYANDYKGSHTENEIQANYKDSLYQVYYDLNLNRQYINTSNGKIYLKKQ